MRYFFLVSIMIFCIGFTSISNAQNTSKESIINYLEEHYKEQKLTKEDVSNWTITNEHHSKQSGVHYVYIRQLHNGIPVFNGVANFAIKNNKVFNKGNLLFRQLGKYTNGFTPKLNATEAIQAAAKQLNIEAPKALTVLETISTNNFVYNKGQISKENIPVQLMYLAVSENDIRLVWDLSIYTLDASHWWSVRVDANTGDLLDKNDWVVHCNFEHSPFTKCNNSNDLPVFSTMSAPKAMIAADQYQVFALPLESPNHGNRTIVINPSDALASPYGWHDDNGAVGAEYTITRGNNVFAYEDYNEVNAPGFSPDGGAALDFTFPYDGANAPNTYQEAAITNLFYMNNMMHDIWYRYGFDEVSGNFQSNNYGRGGQAGDFVLAEALDGGGTNNANFATPSDGFNPRMQMYLWSAKGGGSANYLNINSPVDIAGPYSATSALFGPSLPATPITADVVLLNDNTVPVNDGCETVTNTAQLAGKIALIDEGNCSFVVKVEAAQNAGALAVIIARNTASALIQMVGTSTTVNIPSIMISQADANAIKAQLSTGTVNASISNAGGVNIARAGDLDNGIIAHEYGHGISIRLAGGPSNSNCLSNPEQMGEGWSDWFGMMLTIEAGDLGTDIRGYATYANYEPITGNGLRPAPYSTDFGVNDFTYASSNNTSLISQPHGIGFIFATVLWDLTWALVDQYGGVPDTDLYNGTGGNNIAMHLVIEALKIQPCNPGMIDGRDAILQADQLLYGGIHECLIWKTFAKRGFGYSASQGSSDSRLDQVEAFDLPPSLLCPAVEPPISSFSSNKMSSCNSYETFNFIDSSTSVPETWSWDFGDGTTSTLQNPSHNYTSSGVFTVQLTVTNTFGSDTSTMQISITLPPKPIVSGVQLCSGDTASVTATVTGDAQWRDADYNIVHVGNTLVVPNVQSINTYYVENVIVTPSEYVGPVDSSIGTGGYHSTVYHGALNFTANKEFEIVSAWVDANGVGPRTFYLASGINNDGTPPSGVAIIDQVTVNLVDGPQRVSLNLKVPASGNYNIGGNNVNLFRNNSGSNYPYTLPGYMTINNSSASGNPTGYYYYLYDLEVKEKKCISSVETVTITPISSDFNYSEVAEGLVNFTDMSTGASDWLWTFGDGESSTNQNPTHTFTSNGSYIVTLSINGGVCEISYNVAVGSVLNINDIIKEEFIISVFPNPADKTAKLILNKALPNVSTVTIHSMDGKKVKSMVLEAGLKEISIPLEQLASQLYLLVLNNDGKKFRTKILVK